MEVVALSILNKQIWFYEVLYCIVKRNKNTPRVNRIPSGLPDIIALLVQYMWFSDFDCWGNIDNTFQELLDALLYGGFFSLKKR